MATTRTGSVKNLSKSPLLHTFKFLTNPANIRKALTALTVASAALPSFSSSPTQQSSALAQRTIFDIAGPEIARATVGSDLAFDITNTLPEFARETTTSEGYWSELLEIGAALTAVAVKRYQKRPTKGRSIAKRHLKSAELRLRELIFDPKLEPKEHLWEIPNLRKELLNGVSAVWDYIYRSGTKSEFINAIDAANRGISEAVRNWADFQGDSIDASYGQIRASHFIELRQALDEVTKHLENLPQSNPTDVEEHSLIEECGKRLSRIQLQARSLGTDSGAISDLVFSTPDYLAHNFSEETTLSLVRNLKVALQSDERCTASKFIAELGNRFAKPPGSPTWRRIELEIEKACSEVVSSLGNESRHLTSDQDVSDSSHDDMVTLRSQAPKGKKPIKDASADEGPSKSSKRSKKSKGKEPMVEDTSADEGPSKSSKRSKKSKGKEPMVEDTSADEGPSKSSKRSKKSKGKESMVEDASADEGPSESSKRPEKSKGKESMVEDASADEGPSESSKRPEKSKENEPRVEDTLADEEPSESRKRPEEKRPSEGPAKKNVTFEEPSPPTPKMAGAFVDVDGDTDEDVVAESSAAAEASKKPKKSKTPDKNGPPPGRKKKRNDSNDGHSEDSGADKDDSKNKSDDSNDDESNSESGTDNNNSDDSDSRAESSEDSESDSDRRTRRNERGFTPLDELISDGRGRLGDETGEPTVKGWNWQGRFATRVCVEYKIGSYTRGRVEKGSYHDFETTKETNIEAQDPLKPVRSTRDARLKTPKYQRRDIRLGTVYWDADESKKPDGLDVIEPSKAANTIYPSTFVECNLREKDGSWKDYIIPRRRLPNLFQKSPYETAKIIYSQALSQEENFAYAQDVKIRRRAQKPDTSRQNKYSKRHREQQMRRMQSTFRDATILDSEDSDIEYLSERQKRTNRSSRSRGHRSRSRYSSSESDEDSEPRRKRSHRSSRSRSTYSSTESDEDPEPRRKQSHRSSRSRSIYSSTESDEDPEPRRKQSHRSSRSRSTYSSTESDEDPEPRRERSHSSSRRRSKTSREKTRSPSVVVDEERTNRKKKSPSVIDADNYQRKGKNRKGSKNGTR